MKKSSLTVLSLILLSSALAACGNNNNENGNASSSPSASASASASSDASGSANAELSGKIKVLTHRTDLVDDGTMAKYAEKFKEKYPNAEVEFEAVTDYANNIKVRLTTGEAGDVNMIDSSLPPSEFPKYYEPLPDSMFEDVYFADYDAYEGKRYGITSGVNTTGIVYNKTAFKNAGIDKIPTTLDELYAAAQKLKDAGITPLYMNYGAQWPVSNWGENFYTTPAGDAKWTDTLISQDAPFTVDGPWGQLISIARTFVEKGWTEKDLSTDNWEMSKGEVASGKAGMYFLGNWVIPQVIGAGGTSEDIGFFPLPYDNSGKYNAPLGGDYYVGVSKDSKNKELAIAWVDFFVKESGYSADSGMMSVLKSQESTIPQFAEFQSFNPTFIESTAVDPRYTEIAKKAEIDLGTGSVDQELIVAKDLQKAFDELNAKWAKAKKDLGY
ncbi:ABC transporter substrate-binding protein [Cohnella thailandensis]|uniref:Extracellular solute-binding protein n=1 Tax=Cohnella thailandensis TaxID=557557 RepID=A0A841SW93_9BACL|nr:extracellular solute-binding protein [Cohnella thailandensis]MBB6636194.1 extracellular solute-binding protein [Cohnella thailandensis]MBP1973837.1 ABC-type glycerol-3-phosphate transport system substrate-binding protein [Cohnella thailandensis]